MIQISTDSFLLNIYLVTFLTFCSLFVHFLFVFMQWDPDTNYKSILILDGGFHNFWITYPMLTTNPKYQVKPKDVPMSNAIIKEIEYPSLTDIKMKADPKNKPPSIPMFDRASKPKVGFNPLPVKR